MVPGARGLTLFSIGLFEGFTNGFVFPLIERHSSRKCCASSHGARGRRIEVNVGEVERGTGGQRDTALDYIFQLAHIAWPMKIEQELHGGRRNAANGLAGFASELFEEKVGESRNVLFMVAERGNIDGDYVQA